ncbi:hypothetical protein SCP_0506120 [Sparassis crispa]|uniref:BPL/LPL catalytic domain-containing protein n=1 Tax=Sparassis crispa TaxID=139825 RepID=A0A401GMU8_9APHY|nr:hypothetical protein SCP_0506120 [Sparassis crispa]GBE83557.1 hypothetical protein SCP_0506120 [Sparassis crispa]
MQAVRLYVERGGSLIAFGATTSVRQQRSARSNLEDMVKNMGVHEDHSLHFVDEASGTCIDLKFGVRSDDSAQPMEIKMPDGTRVDGVLSSGKSGPSDIAGGVDMEVLAEYADGASRNGAAGISCRISNGRAAFWDLYVEYPLTAEPACSILMVSTPTISAAQVGAAERQRQTLVHFTLERLGLQLPARSSTSRAVPLPQILTAHPSRPEIVAEILTALSIPDVSASSHILRDSNDTFYFHDSLKGREILDEARTLADTNHDPSNWQPKHVIAFLDGKLPSHHETPLFDMKQYYDALYATHSEADLKYTAGEWGMGEALLYGEVVTSTQTLLDKNHTLLSSFPTPLLSLATHQLAGRGRGSNVWISPPGCLLFSLLLRVSLSALPAVRLVFVQYLFGLAVVEACRYSDILGAHGESVRLKWPNDIYAGIGEEKKKIGGILVHTSFSEGKVDIVIGCGLNVLNSPPITSLAQLVPEGSDIQLSAERTVAVIMAQFEKMWGTFLADHGSFDAFMDLYLDRWLHSDQLVTLTTVNPPMKVRVVGITSDHGMLRTIPERNVWSGESGPRVMDSAVLARYFTQNPR